MFRSGMVTPVVHEREIGSGAKEQEKEKPPPKPAKKMSTATDGTAAAKATLPPAKSGGAKTDGAKTNGRAPTNGRKPAAGKRATNGKAAGGDDSVEDAPAPKSHPRSRAKRTRKAR
jgi:hypothetical protein